MTRSSTASPLLSIFHWYSTFGSKNVVLASAGGMKPCTVITKTRLSGVTGLRKVYMSAMSAAGSAARSALSLWSDAVIHCVRPSAAAVASSRLHAITRPRDRGAAKRSMVHSSWKKRTGVELHRLYARPGVLDCRALPAALPRSHEERLLGGLPGAARGLFGHGAQIGLESGGHAQCHDDPAARGGVERADAHRCL